VSCFEGQVGKAPAEKREILEMFLKNYRDKAA